MKTTQYTEQDLPDYERGEHYGAIPLDEVPPYDGPTLEQLEEHWGGPTTPSPEPMIPKPVGTCHDDLVFDDEPISASAPSAAKVSIPTGAAEVDLESAMTHLLIADGDLLMEYGPLLNDRRLFIDPRNHAIVAASHALRAADRFAPRALYVELERVGKTSAADKIFANAAKAAEIPGDFRAHYATWVERARLRHYERAEADNLDGLTSSDDIFAARQMALEESRKAGISDVGVTMEEALAEAEQWQVDFRRSGGKGIVSTGFEQIDDRIIGLLPGTLTVVGARPNGGKTTIGCSIALNGAGQGPVIFNSLEMAPARIASKMAAMANGENPFHYDRAFKLNSDDHFARNMARMRSQAALGVRFFEQHDPLALESAIIQLRPSLVVWDFIQIVHTPPRFSGRRHEFVAEVARHLQQIAKRRGVPIVVLSQLNRGGEDGATMSSLKDSGGIEEAADNVLLLERPHQGEPGADGLKALLRLAKARSGFPGAEMELMMNPVTGTFEKWDTMQAAQLAEAAGI